MSFINDDFLLHNDVAKILYHNYASTLPIIDYHCHISPKDIYEDRRYHDLYELWLEADHYKWRLMRNHGIDEYYITGNAEPFEKFKAFVASLSMAIGNPLYHWCHLELKRYFDYDGILNEDNALKVWNLANEKLKYLSARKIIEMSNVYLIGTTDDPIDDLYYHARLKEDNTFKTIVIPTFRPDNILNIEKDNWVEYAKKLGNISDLASLKDVLLRRMDHFAAMGCKSADHGLNIIEYADFDEDVVNEIIKRRLDGYQLSKEEIIMYKSCLLKYCAKQYKLKNWVMQLHFNCLRDPNTRMYQLLNKDAGFDTIDIHDSSYDLKRLLDSLYQDDCLCKMIIYSLDKNDDLFIDALIGSFQYPNVRGYLQHGCAWWFNDHKKGIIEHLTNLASVNILGDFVGMLTDSRSFLSYTRHEYFRRILCNYIGEMVVSGEYPDDDNSLKKLVMNICFYNAYEYFDLKEG